MNGGPIKIGTTTQLTQRLAYLRADTGNDLRVLGVMDGDRAEERSFHRHFSHLRIGKSSLNEWVHPTEDLLRFIEEKSRMWDGIDERPKPKAGGTLLRMSDEFAEAIRDASSLEKLSVADFATAILLPIVTKRYRDTLISKTRKVEGKG